MYTPDKVFERVGLIVAHPDDETLWAGGSLLINSFKECFVLSLCRKKDRDRAPRFFRALKQLGVDGAMADLNDGPEQTPLQEDLINRTILENLPPAVYDRIYTHSPLGEYTRHVRHEETGHAVLDLWLSRGLKTKEICLFAYDDGKGAYLPKPIEEAPVQVNLPDNIWQKKHHIITKIYNFKVDSFEAQTTPVKEAFWLINTHEEAKKWLKKGSIK